MSFEGIVKAIGDMAPNAMEAYSRLFPGTAMRSADGAASSSVHAIMTDYDDAATWARNSGAPTEIQQVIVNAILEKHGTDQRVGRCFEFAEPLIDEAADPYDVDDEWLDYWRVHAGMAHTEDMQAMWGAVLAGEVNKPGAVSKRTMSILSDMGRDDAEVFKRYCSLCIRLGDKVLFYEPFALEEGEEADFTARTVPLSDIGRIFAFGLIDTERIVNVTKAPVVMIGGNPYSLELPSGGLNLAHQPSAFGEELSVFCGIGTFPGLVDEIAADLAKRGGRLFRRRSA